MVWIAAAAIVCTIIGAFAYVYPKVAFLALQEAIVLSQKEVEQEKLDAFKTSLKETADSGGFASPSGYV